MCHGFLYNILKNQPGTPVTLAVKAKKNCCEMLFFAKGSNNVKQKGQSKVTLGDSIKNINGCIKLILLWISLIFTISFNNVVFHDM